jgi:hypothetical protein
MNPDTIPATALRDLVFKDTAGDTLKISKTFSGAYVDLRIVEDDRTSVARFPKADAVKVAQAILKAAGAEEPAPARPAVGAKVRVKEGARYYYAGTTFQSDTAARYVGNVVTVADPSVLMDKANVRVRSTDGTFFAVMPEFVEPVAAPAPVAVEPSPDIYEATYKRALGLAHRGASADDVLDLARFLLGE